MSKGSKALIFNLCVVEVSLALPENTSKSATVEGFTVPFPDAIAVSSS
jgi:ABC-type transport system involved in cytochrome c biogenesis permease subunit